MFEKITKTRAIALAIILVLIFIIYSSIKSCGKTINLVYNYDEVTKGEVKKTISVTGKLEVVDPQVIISKIAGSISNLYVDFNQHVKAGQLLATIDSSEIEQNILRSAAQFEKARLDVEEAERDLTVKKDMMKDNLISKREMELAELKYRKILAQYKQIKIDYTIAQQSKSFTKILSPINGIVISREIETKRPVAPNTAMFIIARSLEKMRLMINVDESDIGNIRKGQKVTFTVSAFPERVFTGEISQVRINPLTKGDVVIYQSMVLCDNKDNLLKPGMTATATILVDQKTGVLRVPNQAFIVSPKKVEMEEGKKVIWRKKTGLIGDLPVDKIEVKTGIIGDKYTEIISQNIKEGEEILTGIHKKLEVKDELSSYGK